MDSRSLSSSTLFEKWRTASTSWWPALPLARFNDHTFCSSAQVDCTIPHYHAVEATNAIKAAFPEHYLYDPTPLPQATWRLATQCAGVENRGDMHVFVNEE